MPEKNEMISLIFSQSEMQFADIALNIFKHQYHHNDIYQAYCNSIRKTPENVIYTEQIPFLPIQFFKSHKVQCDHNEPAIIFESSGTTGTIPSRHFVSDVSIYEMSFLKSFELFYGKPNQYCIIGLLPSYLERKHSSLVYMTDQLIRLSENKDSGFYLYDHAALHELLLKNERTQHPTMLIGVSYALLDFTEQYQFELKHTIIMETGGMKGRRAEMTKSELHRTLRERFGTEQIHSEYGMTELLSQAYSKSDEIFSCPPWMKILLRPEDDPLSILKFENSEKEITGGINIIDLANIKSCSFIATEDRGKLYRDGRFEVLGRMENSDVRGCSQLVVGDV